MKNLIVKLWEVMGYITLIGGIIMTCVTAAGSNQMFRSLFYSMGIDPAGIGIVSFVVGIIFTILSSLVPFTIAAVLERVASIKGALEKINQRQ